MSKLGVALATAAEQLYRQVNPNFMHGDTLTSQVFEATKKDQGLLSVTRSSKTTAKEAFECFLARNCRSLGVVAVTVAEVGQIGLKAYDDVQSDEAAHAVSTSMGSQRVMRAVLGSSWQLWPRLAVGVIAQLPRCA